MKRTILSAVIAITLLGGHPSCVHINEYDANSHEIDPSGIDTIIPIQLDSYDGIETSSTVEIIMADTIREPYMIIDKNLIDAYTISTAGRTLKIHPRSRISLKRFSQSQSCRLLLPANKGLKAIDLSGASSIKTHAAITAREFGINLAGASTAEVDFDNPQGRVEIDLTGASSLTLSGNTGSLDLESSGASIFNGPIECHDADIECSGTAKTTGITAANANIESSGASDIKVICHKKLSVEASGSSRITYSGDCQTDIRTSGISTANKE